MRAKIRQLFCLIVIVIIVLAIGAAAINVYMVWGTKGRILKKDQWANFKADGVVVFIRKLLLKKCSSVEII